MHLCSVRVSIHAGGCGSCTRLCSPTRHRAKSDSDDASETLASVDSTSLSTEYVMRVIGKQKLVMFSHVAPSLTYKKTTFLLRKSSRKPSGFELFLLPMNHWRMLIIGIKATDIDLLKLKKFEQKTSKYLDAQKSNPK